MLTIIVPMFNEEAVLPELHRRLQQAMVDCDVDWELLLVDDGSEDESWALAQQLYEQHDNVCALKLSRNFGKEIAMSAGLEAARGDAVVIIDADLQDPPELIPTFVQHWRDGYDVVFGQRTERDGESWLKKVTAHGFYRIINRLSSTPIPKDTGDFRLLSRRAVDALNKLPERHRFMKGLFAWVGYRQVAVPYHRHGRFAGRSKFNYWRLFNFALEGITSFSTAPLRLATLLGLATALLSLAYAVWVIVKTVLFGDPVAGYPSLMVVLLFLGGVQLLSLGVIGEYLGRLFDESKQRPLYLVEQVLAGSAVTEHSRRDGNTG